MSRLDDALRDHERKLRDELTRAHKKRAELAIELLNLDKTIQDTEADLAEVANEIGKRDITLQKARTYVIEEGPYD
ncbi:MAG TPA: hypothetical protein VFH56_02905 [Acidimicrobiales bacterium]|nr:hypothetical protein [Acidimicrobiales bacterium]